MHGQRRQYPRTMFTTDRLLLRRWRPSDVPVFAAMNQDPRVMEHFPSHMTPDQTEEMVRRVDRQLGERGWGLWALEFEGAFVGFTGLTPPRFEAHFTPAVEVGWRLMPSAWGKGLATEAATEALRVGFDVYCMDEIVSMTIPNNTRSIAVMERLGMSRDPADDFDHPMLPDWPLRRHLLYRMSATAFHEGT